MYVHVQTFPSGCIQYMKVDITPGFGWVIKVLTDEDLVEEASSKHAARILSSLRLSHTHYIVKFRGPLDPNAMEKGDHTYHVLFSEDYSSARLISPDGKESMIPLGMHIYSERMHEITLF